MLSAALRDILCVSLLWTSTHRVPAVAKQLQKACSPGVPFGKTRQCFVFFLPVCFFVWSENDIIKYEWEIWLVPRAPCLQGPGGVVKTIRLLTVVPSWDTEGQMVCSQQVITASMLIHWHPHKWVTRTTQSIWDAVIVPSPASLWGFFYRVWHRCCANDVVSNEKGAQIWIFSCHSLNGKIILFIL